MDDVVLKNDMINAMLAQSGQGSQGEKKRKCGDFENGAVT